MSLLSSLSLGNMITYPMAEDSCSISPGLGSVDYSAIKDASSSSSSSSSSLDQFNNWDVSPFELEPGFFQIETSRSTSLGSEQSNSSSPNSSLHSGDSVTVRQQQHANDSPVYYHRIPIRAFLRDEVTFVWRWFFKYLMIADGHSLLMHYEANCAKHDDGLDAIIRNMILHDATMHWAWRIQLRDSSRQNFASPYLDILSFKPLHSCEPLWQGSDELTQSIYIESLTYKSSAWVNSSWTHEQRIWSSNWAAIGNLDPDYTEYEGWMPFFICDTLKTGFDIRTRPEFIAGTTGRFDIYRLTCPLACIDVRNPSSCPFMSLVGLTEPLWRGSAALTGCFVLHTDSVDQLMCDETLDDDIPRSQRPT